MINNNERIKDMLYIALGVAIIIGGGFAIVQIGMTIPIPGMKYILMAPYQSTVLYIVLRKVKSRWAISKIGGVYAAIMSLISVFMGVAIILTALFTQLSSGWISKKSKRAFVAAAMFSGYTGLSSLTVSKYIIGGVFADISNWWILVATFISLGFGCIGVMVAKKVLKHIKIAIVK